MTDFFVKTKEILLATKWPVLFSHLFQGWSIFYTYVCTLYAFIFRNDSYTASTAYEGDQWAKVQVYSLSLIFKLWSLKHYRSASFQQDMIDNLKNVAIPGTGLALSWFCYSYWTCLWYIMFANPIICMLGAVNKVRKEPFVSLEDAAASLVGHFTRHLLHPDDWFSFWRLNCRLVSYHSALSSHPDYLQEDKWTFLTLGKSLGVPVSPYFDQFKNLVCKNKNIEGGMGIFFYQNAAHGGDWIIQERLDNAEWLQKLLPPNAPLSTMRVITTSTYALTHNDAANIGTKTDTAEDSDEPIALSKLSQKYVRAESGLLRLGRANASTDHSSVLFDVDISTGVIKQGTSNAHWYIRAYLKILLVYNTRTFRVICFLLYQEEVLSGVNCDILSTPFAYCLYSLYCWYCLYCRYQLGLAKGLACPWLPPSERVTRHADSPYPEVTGPTIPFMQEALKIVTE